MKKSLKIALISSAAVIGVCVICLFIFHPFGAGFVIDSIFSKNYNDDEPFSNNGLFTYENNGKDDIDIKKLGISIKEYQKTQDYDAVFKHSKGPEFGINFEITIGNDLISNYSVAFLKKEKTLREPHHYTYLYHFELKTTNNEYTFDLESKGERFLAFSFNKPINTYTILENELKLQED